MFTSCSNIDEVLFIRARMAQSITSLGVFSCWLMFIWNQNLNIEQWLMLNDDVSNFEIQINWRCSSNSSRINISILLADYCKQNKTAASSQCNRTVYWILKCNDSKLKFHLFWHELHQLAKLIVFSARNLSSYLIIKSRQSDP